MSPTGSVQLIAVLGLILIAGLIWLATKAKPIGDFPYKWGLWIGINMAFGGLVYLALALSSYAKGAILGGIALTLLAFLGAGAGVGIMRRRRWGVVLFTATYGLDILGSVFAAVTNLSTTPRGSDDPGGLQGFVSLIVKSGWCAVTTLYFQKRWKLMGTSWVELPTHTDVKPLKGFIYTESELEAMESRSSES